MKFRIVLKEDRSKPKHIEPSGLFGLHFDQTIFDQRIQKKADYLKVLNDFANWIYNQHSDIAEFNFPLEVVQDLGYHHLKELENDTDFLLNVGNFIKAKEHIVNMNRFDMASQFVHDLSLIRKEWDKGHVKQDDY